MKMGADQRAIVLPVGSRADARFLIWRKVTTERRDYLERRKDRDPRNRAHDTRSRADHRQKQKILKIADLRLQIYWYSQVSA